MASHYIMSNPQLPLPIANWNITRYPSVNFVSTHAPHLTHWGRVTHICVDKLTTIGSDNSLSPGWRQAITWTNVGILLIGPLGTNVSEILSGIQTFSFKKMHLKMSSAKWRPFRLGLNVLILQLQIPHGQFQQLQMLQWQLTQPQMFCGHFY